MPERGGISSFTLKVIAIVGMTCNHAAYLFADQLPFPLYCALEGAGGLTFPIMAFLLTEGFRHTSDVKRYGMRLAVFAAVAQVPYQLFMDAEGNVLVTLLIGLLLLQLNKVCAPGSGRRLLFWLAVAAGVALSAFCDWGIVGVAMILIADMLPTQRERALYSAALPALAWGIPAFIGVAGGTIALLPTMLYALGCAAAGVLLCCYNGRRGKPMKWFFYAYYPVHIAVLGIVHGLLFGM